MGCNKFNHLLLNDKTWIHTHISRTSHIVMQAMEINFRYKYTFFRSFSLRFLTCGSVFHWMKHGIKRFFFFLELCASVLYSSFILLNFINLNHLTQISCSLCCALCTLRFLLRFFSFVLLVSFSIFPLVRISFCNFFLCSFLICFNSCFLFYISPFLLASFFSRSHFYFYFQFRVNVSRGFMWTNGHLNRFYWHFTI